MNKLGFVFNNCVNNFERVADHCSNIAVAVLETGDAGLQSHDYLRSIKQNHEEVYQHWLKEYQKEYCDVLASLEQQNPASQISLW